MDNKPVTRREFMCNSAKVAAGLAVGIGGLKGGQICLGANRPEVKSTRSYNPDMEYRRLGKTGLWVSAVGLGGHWKRVGRIIGHRGKITGSKGFDPRRSDSPALAAKLKEIPGAFYKNRYDVVTRCIELGINYLDAANGGELDVYAKTLQGRRDSMYLAASWSSFEMRSPEHRTEKKMLETIENGLKRANLEYIDIWRISALLEPIASTHTEKEVDEMLKALTKAKKQGKCRFTGVSSHDRAWTKMLVEKYPELDVVMLPYTAASKVLPRHSVFDAIIKNDVGVAGIKPFSSGSLFKGDGTPGNPNAEEDDAKARLAIRYILCNPAVTVPLAGMASVHHVDNMARAIKERRQLDANEKAQLRQAADEMLARLPADYQWLKTWNYV